MENLPEDMQDIMQYAIQVGREVLKDRGCIDPVAFLLGGTVSKFVNSNSFPNKEDFLIHLDTLARSYQPNAILFVSEAYTLKKETEASPKEIEELMKTYGSIKNHPDAVEAVFFSLEMAHTMYIGTAPIFVNDEIRTFGEVKFTEAERVEGRFANLMQQRHHNETLH